SRVAAPAPPVAPPAAPLFGAFGDVGQERHLSRALHRLRDLDLMPPARAGDPPAADLPLLGDVAAELVDVLVVDLGDLLLAEEAVATLDRGGGAGALPLWSPLPRHQNGMSSSVLDGKSALSAVAPAGTNWLPPSTPSPRPPRNWTLSAMICTAWRFEPSCAAHSR